MHSFCDNKLIRALGESASARDGIGCYETRKQLVNETFHRSAITAQFSYTYLMDRFRTAKQCLKIYYFS